MTLAEALMLLLARSGTKRVFGVPGREVASISFAEVPGIEYVTARAEFGAGIMADGAATVSGRTQVCFATMGPGATGLTTPAASAMLNHSPVVFISAQLESNDRHYNVTHQCVDQRSVLAPLTKLSYELESPAQLQRALRQALEVASTEPCGPVHLSIPSDFFTEEVVLEEQSSTVERAAPADDCFSQVDAASLVLRDAVSAVCIVGDEAVRTGALDAVRGFVEAWHIPTLTSSNAKGFLINDGLLHLGAASCYMEGILGIPALDELFRDVDVVVLIGYQYVDDILPKIWQRGRQKRVIAFSGSVRAFMGPVEVEVVCEGSMVRSLDRITRLAPANRSTWARASLISRLNERRRAITAQPTLPLDGLTPGQIAGVLNEFLDDAICVTDIGYYRHHFALLLEPSQPRSFITDAGLSSFGTGLPRAIGIQLEQPEKRVFLVAGDGGFLASACELETAVRMGVRLTVLLLDNQSFELIKNYQARGGRPNESVVRLGNVDFCGLATSMGCRGSRARSVQELRKLLEVEQDVPHLIHISLIYDDEFAISF